MTDNTRLTRRTLLASTTVAPAMAIPGGTVPAMRKALAIVPTALAADEPAPPTIPVAPVCAQTDPLAPLEPTLQAFAEARATLRNAQPLPQRLDVAVEFSQSVMNQSDPDADNDFRYHQVEQLMSQAATLLERGIASRSEWQNLYERYFAIFLELKEFDDLDAIHADETAHGYYALAPIASQTDSYAQALMLERTTLGSVGAIGLYTPPDGAMTAQGVQKLQTDTDVANDQLSAGERQALNNLAMRSYAVANATLSNQYHLAIAQKAVTAARKAEAEFKDNYDRCDVEFRRRRTESARRMNVLKTVGFTQEGGSYNYRERMEPIAARFAADFKDAISRMRVINLGMQKIYDYSMTIPQSSSTPFDSALLSLRNAMEWLVRFALRSKIIFYRYP